MKRRNGPCPPQGWEQLLCGAAAVDSATTVAIKMTGANALLACAANLPSMLLVPLPLQFGCVGDNATTMHQTGSNWQVTKSFLAGRFKAGRDASAPRNLGTLHWDRVIPQGQPEGPAGLPWDLPLQ